MDIEADIVDAQIHLWSSGLPSNASHIQVTAFVPQQAIEMMDEAGVAAAVIHPPSWDPDSLELALSAVREWPRRFAVMGSLPLDDPQSWSQLAHWREQPNMLGLRYTFLSEPARARLHAGDFDALFAHAERAGVPVSMLATDSLDYIGVVAERHPGLRLTVDHLGGRGGLTTLKDDAAMTHMPALLALARHPNVAVKATGAPGYSAEAFPYPTLCGYVRRVFDAFGPERTFWGTDITKMPCSWRECITMFTEHMPWMSSADLDLVMGDAICAWWGWPRDASVTED